MGYLECNYQSSTIKSYISAVKAVLEDDEHPLDENRCLLKALIRACRLKNDTMRTKIPIKKDLLFGLMRKLSDLFAIQPYLCVLYRAMFITAYFGLFRISEIATTPSGHTIRAHDVHLTRNKNKLLFILRSSKTHGKGAQPQMIRISAQENEQTENNCSRKLTFCPFNCRDYISARRSIKKDTEPFFIFSDRSPVMASHFTTVLKKTIKSLNLNS